MKNLDKYKGVFPAFYACYDKNGEISSDGVRSLTQFFIEKGLKGTYVCGSSGECIYQSVEERKRTLEAIMEVARGKLTVIAHVACNNTRDSVELAKHAESLGVDAIAAIPPIYFHLPDYAIEEYWNTISAAAPNTDFVIYNIPQLAGTALSLSLFKNMIKNPRVIAVKNSSPYVQDIMNFKEAGGDDRMVFNGPDEQFVAGFSIGAEGGIGGTYAVMPELFLKMEALIKRGDFVHAKDIQYRVNEIIRVMYSAHGNLYAIMKEVLRRREGLELGGVRPPMPAMIDADLPLVESAIELISDALEACKNW